MFYKRNKKMSSFLRRLRKNPNKKLNVLLEEDYKAIEFFKNKGFDINYVTLSFFRVCKAKNQLIKLNVNTMNYLNHCFKFSEEETDSKKNFYLVKSLCKFLSRNYYGIFDPSDENLSKIQSLWPIWDKECSSIYKFCTDKKTVKSHLQVIENVIDEKNIVEINLECVKMELDILKTKTNIKKSSFVNLLNQNKSLIDENQRLRNKYEKKDKERCPICLEDIDNFIITVCNHKFCNDCFIPWVQKEDTCPVCRYNLISPVESNGLLTREEGLG
tara:strand:- start:168 stop:983 length:816 start_codon:yes stop_codon:yes gene_type:complete